VVEWSERYASGAKPKGP